MSSGPESLEPGSGPRSLEPYGGPVLEAFARYLAGKGLSKGTIDKYVRTVKRLGHMDDPISLELSPNTIGAYRAALTHFYEWRTAFGDDREFPILPVPRKSDKLPLYIDPKWVPVVLSMDAAYKTGRSLRVRLRSLAVAALVFCGGLRVGEIEHLRAGDINRTEMKVTVHSGKGGKSRVVPLFDMARPHIEHWLDYRPAHSPWMFPGQTSGGHISQRQLREDFAKLLFYAGAPPPPPTEEDIKRGRKGGVGIVVKVIDEETGEEKEVKVRGWSPHPGRSTYAMTLLKRGVAINVIAVALGHSNMSTTFQYLRVLATEIEGPIREASEELSRMWGM